MHDLDAQPRRQREILNLVRRVITARRDDRVAGREVNELSAWMNPAVALPTTATFSRRAPISAPNAS